MTSQQKKRRLPRYTIRALLAATTLIGAMLAGVAWWRTPYERVWYDKHGKIRSRHWVRRTLWGEPQSAGDRKTIRYYPDGQKMIEGYLDADRRDDTKWKWYSRDGKRITSDEFMYDGYRYIDSDKPWTTKPPAD